MNKNEVKKSLYQEKPTAYLVNVSKEGLLYSTRHMVAHRIFFRVPIEDLGDVSWGLEMPGQLLIKWIMNEEQNEEQNRD